MKKITMLALFCIISGCATQYQSGQFSLTGGHINFPVTDKLEKIIFYANGFTGQSVAKKYALFRSAEYASEKNKPYFIMYPSLTYAALEKKTHTPTVGSVDNKPSAFCYVLLLENYQDGAIKTKEILDQLNASKIGGADQV